MKILFLTKYTENGASSRYRTYQYLKYFKDFDFNVFPLFDDSYIPGQYLKSTQSKTYIFKRYIKRLFKLFKLKKDDIVCLEYEFFPYLPFETLLIKILRIKYIVDYDDAIFHNYDQHKNIVIRCLLKHKIKNIIKNAKVVITGSPYLTNYASYYNKNVVEIPTSIDIEKYHKDLKVNKTSKKIVIGWIGSTTTSKNLISIIPVFKKLLKNNIDFELRFIGFDKTQENKFNGLPITFVKWKPNTEIEEIFKFDTGIMPLEINKFNKGKCAFKLIQYMACGLPTISTPLESNIKVDRGNGNLFASSLDDWYSGVIEIYSNKEKYMKIGLKNIETVRSHYSIQSNYELYKKTIIES
jgi:glycosyltransferase involved in cell wall biosynthesis